MQRPRDCITMYPLDDVPPAFPLFACTDLHSGSKPQAHDCPMGQVQLCSRFSATLGATLKAKFCAVQPNACVCFGTCFKHVLSVAACLKPCCGSQHTNQHLGFSGLNVMSYTQCSVAVIQLDLASIAVRNLSTIGSRDLFTTLHLRQ